MPLGLSNECDPTGAADHTQTLLRLRCIVHLLGGTLSHYRCGGEPCGPCRLWRRSLRSSLLRRTKACDSRLIARVTTNQDFAVTDGGGKSNVKKTPQYFLPMLVPPIYAFLWIWG